MSSYIDDATAEAVEATRERRRKATEAAAKKRQQRATSEPRQSARDKSKSSGSKA